MNCTGVCVCHQLTQSTAAIKKWAGLKSHDKLQDEMVFGWCGQLHRHPFSLCVCNISVSNEMSRAGFCRRSELCSLDQNY